MNIETPFYEMGQFATFFYFYYFLYLVPKLNNYEKELLFSYKFNLESILLNELKVWFTRGICRRKLKY